MSAKADTIARLTRQLVLLGKKAEPLLSLTPELRIEKIPWFLDELSGLDARERKIIQRIRELSGAQKRFIDGRRRGTMFERPVKHRRGYLPTNKSALGGLSVERKYARLWGEWNGVAECLNCFSLSEHSSYNPPIQLEAEETRLKRQYRRADIRTRIALGPHEWTDYDNPDTFNRRRSIFGPTESFSKWLERQWDKHS